MHTDTVKEAAHPNERENMLTVLLEMVLFSHFDDNSFIESECYYICGAQSESSC